MLVNVAAVANLDNKYPQHRIFDRSDNSKITHAIFPQMAQLRSAKCSPQFARIVVLRQTLAKETQNSQRVLPVEPIQIAKSSRREVKVPNHIS